MYVHVDFNFVKNQAIPTVRIGEFLNLSEEGKNWVLHPKGCNLSRGMKLKASRMQTQFFLTLGYESVEITDIYSHYKTFHEITSLVTSLVETLFSRNFYQKNIYESKIP